jgi:N-acetyl-gamma-glutamyl-phosphate reductase
LISKEHLVIDAKSGTSGAGRKANEGLLFSEVTGECLPYKVGRHQHTPEIIETVSQFCKVEIDPHFSTHLLPVDRGIIAGIYAESFTSDINQVKAAFDEAFADYPFVRHAAGSVSLMKLKNVVKTPFVHISYELVGKKLYIFSLIDNLMKGAASQAVENFNRQWDFPIATGLKGGNER